MKNWICAGLFAFFLASPAMAFPQEETRRIKVDYSDLDLTKQQGVIKLERRVKGAVRQVCGDSGISLHEKALQRECARKAGTQAADDVAKAVDHAWRGRTWPMNIGHQPR